MTDKVETIEGETCPICSKKTLTLMEAERDIPFFGLCYLFGMDCTSCGYHKADVEAAETKKPVKIAFTVEDEEDLKVRVIKSSNATVKLGVMGTIEPGEASNGYITNVEGVLNRFLKQVEHLRDAAEDDGEKKKAKNMVKKLQRVLWGRDALKISVTDPTGNSAVISDKAVVK